jgi:two-component system OmpR family sensor kinase
VTARVLVVEDAEAIRTAVLAGLDAAGFVASGRADGRELEQDLATVRPDLVVLDVSLLVLAAVLLVVGVLTDVVFSAQTRSDLRGELTVRAGLAGELAQRSARPAEILRRVEGPGIRAMVVTPTGQVVRSDERGPGPGRGERDGEELRRELPDGSRLTLVAADEQVTSAQRRLRRTMFLLSVAALTVAGLVMLLTTRYALAPLDAMTRVARSITRGDRGRRLGPTRTDTELGRTAAAFDAMLDELEGAERQARSAEAVARASEARTRRFVVMIPLTAFTSVIRVDPGPFWGSTSVPRSMA